MSTFFSSPVDLRNTPKSLAEDSIPESVTLFREYIVGDAKRRVTYLPLVQRTSENNHFEQLGCLTVSLKHATCPELSVLEVPCTREGA